MTWRFLDVWQDHVVLAILSPKSETQLVLRNVDLLQSIYYFHEKTHCSYLRNMANPNPSCPSPPLNDTERDKRDHNSGSQTFDELRRLLKTTSDEDFRVVGVWARWGLSFQGSETPLGGRVDDAHGWHLPISAARRQAPDMLRCISQQRHQPHHAPCCKHTKMHQQRRCTASMAQQLLPSMKSSANTSF